MRDKSTSFPVKTYCRISSVYFFYYAGYCWFPFFSLYLTQNGFSGIQIGSITAIRPLMSMLVIPLWGIAADLFGRRRIMLFCILFSSFFLPLFGLNPSYLYCLFVCLLVSFFSTPSGMILDSIALDHIQQTKRLAFGHYRLWGAVGWSIVLIVAGRVIRGKGVETLFYFGSGFLLICFILGNLKVSGEGKADIKKDWSHLGEVLKNRNLLFFLFLVLIMRAGTSCILVFQSVYMHEIGASNSIIGLSQGIQGFSEIPFYIFSAWLIKKAGVRRTLMISFFMYAVRLLLYAAINKPLYVLAVDTLHGFSFSLFLISSVEYVNTSVPEQWRSTGQTLLGSVLFGAGAILGNLWSGWLLDSIDIQSVFRINGMIVFCLAAIFCFTVLIKEKNKTAAYAKSAEKAL